LLAAKARRYAAMSTAGAGGAVGDADQFLVDFEQKRYDDDGSEREVDALAAAASSDTPCPLRSELELHAASQSTQAAVARRQRDAALQVRLRRSLSYLCYRFLLFYRRALQNAQRPKGTIRDSNFASLQ
jgi:hypothetical protein